jgi:hypothetical protein
MRVLWQRVGSTLPLIPVDAGYRNVTFVRVLVDQPNALVPFALCADLFLQTERLLDQNRDAFQSPVLQSTSKAMLIFSDYLHHLFQSVQRLSNRHLWHT